jgi:hypothetical protein
MAAPRELSPVRKDTVVDANYGRARTLIEHYEQVRQVYQLLNLPDDSPILPASILSIFDSLASRFFAIPDR